MVTLSINLYNIDSSSDKTCGFKFSNQSGKILCLENFTKFLNVQNVFFTGGEVAAVQLLPLQPPSALCGLRKAGLENFDHVSHPINHLRIAALHQASCPACPSPVELVSSLKSH